MVDELNPLIVPNMLLSTASFIRTTTDTKLAPTATRVTKIKEQRTIHKAVLKTMKGTLSKLLTQVRIQTM